MNCKKCRGEMVPGFTDWYCKAECDLESSFRIQIIFKEEFGVQGIRSLGGYVPEIFDDEYPYTIFTGVSNLKAFCELDLLGKIKDVVAARKHEFPEEEASAIKKKMSSWGVEDKDIRTETNVFNSLIMGRVRKK